MEQHICSCTHKKPITGKYDCLAYVRGNVAYALDALPQTHVEITTGLPWAQNVIYLCTQHHRMFCQGKALHLSYSIPDQLYIEINNVQEDSMNQPIIPFRLCCGQQHLGNVCPDNTIMCEICFGKFTAEQWDNEIGCCKECAVKEKDFQFRLNNDLCTCTINANGEIVAPHYTCSHHLDLYSQYIANGHKMPTTSKEDNMNTDQTIPTYGPEMDDVNAPFITAGEMRINNERIENNFPKSWPELEGDLTKRPGYAKCSACSKEIGEDWYHPVQLIRTCLGAAPAPEKYNGRFAKVFNQDTMNYDYTSNDGTKIVFDASKDAIFALVKTLKAQGCTIIKVAKSKKGQQNWYVSYRES